MCRSLTLPTVCVMAVLVIAPPPLAAHNQIVHQDMTDMAYEIMLMVLAGEGRLTTRPNEIGAAEWNAFLADVSAAVPRLQALQSQLPPPQKNACTLDGTSFTLASDWAAGSTLGDVEFPVDKTYMTGSACGLRNGWRPGGVFNEFNNGAPRDHTGLTLGFWASNVDDQVCDTHLWIRPTSAGGLGALKDFADDLIDFGLEVLLLPFVCLIDCIFSDCENCAGETSDIADAANPIDDLEGLLPGFGDISGSDWVGMWHHINVQPTATNEYDDNQGLLFDEAELGGIPDVVDLTLMAVFDASGLSVNAGDSEGVSRYQIQNADDGRPNTDLRSTSEWQFTTIAHTPFEPVDNLAYFGWRKFRDEAGHPVMYLGWPLHAIGDATVPMHVIASSAWGHRPFEDGQEQLWTQLRMTDVDLNNPADGAERIAQIFQCRRILQSAFRWRKVVLDWRAQHPGHDNDTPVRDLVTQVAKETYAYSLAKQLTDLWPFHPAASVTYLASEGTAISLYADRSDAVPLGQPLIENGVAATLALLVSAAEVMP